MIKHFPVENLDLERLLSEWRWLCPQRVSLIARTAFGDLFLRDEAGAILWLNSAVGILTKVADSEAEFRRVAATPEKRSEWFAEEDFRAGLSRGLDPTSSQCIGLSVPVVFAESGSSNAPYIADLYEYVSFLGDLNQQISSVPDGTKVALRIQPPKPVS